MSEREGKEGRRKYIYIYSLVVYLARYIKFVRCSSNRERESECASERGSVRVRIGLTRVIG